MCCHEAASWAIQSLSTMILARIWLDQQTMVAVLDDTSRRLMSRSRPLLTAPVEVCCGQLAGASDFSLFSVAGAKERISEEHHGL